MKEESGLDIPASKPFHIGLDAGMAKANPPSICLSFSLLQAILACITRLFPSASRLSALVLLTQIQVRTAPSM